MKLALKKFRRRVFYYYMRLKQRKMLRAVREKLAGKNSLKVIFLVSDKSVWKVDSVFRLMLSHPSFEPIILTVPYTNRDETLAQKALTETTQYFNEQQYPVLNAWDEMTNSWISLESLGPDLLFFANPHKLTKPEYYLQAYKRYLSFHVPYTLEVTIYKDNMPQYNQAFHNAMWKIYVPHQESQRLYQNYSGRKGHNVEVTGFPAVEPLITTQSNAPTAWRTQDKPKLKIIWAPHHTITMSALPMSNFLRDADYFKQLAFDKQESIQWAFKPHPMLRDNLFKHPHWGPEKTNAYYGFWECSPYTQLEEGEYEDLFLESSAMIHDSCSFLAEYLFTNNPVLFCLKSESVRDYLSTFGQDALDCHSHAHTQADIGDFVQSVESGNIAQMSQRFFDQYPDLAGNPDSLPSRRIVNDLLTSLQGHG